jgi:hypothetical protein
VVKLIQIIWYNVVIVVLFYKGYGMKLLVTGSRVCSISHQDLVRYILMKLNWLYEDKLEVIVGDADGIDNSVIEFCDSRLIPLTVYGAYGKMRHSTKTGKNVPTNLTYLGRDDLMASLCDKVVAMCVNKSSGTMYTFNQATKVYNKKGLLIEKKL